MSLDSELMRGALTTRELRQRLGVSAATLSRVVRDSRDVVRIGRTRATRYALQQRWPQLDIARHPLIRITDSGQPEPVGELLTLAGRQTLVLPGAELHDGLPIELADMRPTGFLGRHFAAQHPDLRLPERVADWADHHVLLAVSRRGEDLPGNLLVGHETFERWQAYPPSAHMRNDYTALADAAINGHPPGSSAGGERPKFGALVDGRHCLVKFAARGTDPVAQRWHDLLVLETLALQLVAEQGIAAARTSLVEAERYVFLESERFDRIGTRGRVAVLSLAAAHDNPADAWAPASARLLERGLISAEDARRLRWLDAFGAHIANTDRHQHNIVFLGRAGTLTLAPAFDQASMLYAPSGDGQVQSAPMPPPRQTADTLDVWDHARTTGHAFWTRATHDLRLSESMRRLAEQNAAALSS